MPLPIETGPPYLAFRRAAYERAALVRAALDARLGLTADEFRVEGGLVLVGPVHDEDALGAVVAELEETGLRYFDDFFEVPGNWPAWLRVYLAGAERAEAGRVGAAREADARGGSGITSTDVSSG